MSVVKVFYDLETTGTDVKKHSVHQIAGMVEVNGRIRERFNIFSRPHPKAVIEKEAMAVCKKSAEEILAYQPMQSAHKELKGVLGGFIDPYNPKEKAWLVGYNNRAFDDLFLRAWFEQNGDTYIGSWFWTDTLDVLVLASEYLIDRRAGMPSFKQQRVAKEIGIVVDETRLHDAYYDVELTRAIYRIVTGIDIEI